MSSLPAPRSGLRACVVVPARDEEALIGGCVDALAAQAGVRRTEYEVLVVLDGCADRTAQRARQAGERHPGLCLHLLDAPRPGVGRARRAGMDLACARLGERPEGLIATTDADSQVAPGWLRAQLDAVGRGARAIGGRITIHPSEEAALAEAVRRERRREARARHARARAEAGPADRSEHGQFSGASIGITVEAYRAAGGIDPLPALEDEAFERTLRQAGVPIERLAAVQVRTSGRRRGRAPRGLAHDLALGEWFARRSHRAGDFALDDLLRGKRGRVSVLVPAREAAATIGPLLDAVRPLEAAGLVDELLVVDAVSRDATVRIAAARGAWVAQESELMPEWGPCRGRGDAMWRALAVTRGDLVVYLDAGTEDVASAYLTGLLGPLLTDPGVALVKGAFRASRPDPEAAPDPGGQVTELVARPLINLLIPDLAGVSQPLAREFAARRDLLEALPFPVGPGVEIATLLDAARRVGVDAIAQVDLGTRRGRRQSPRALTATAHAVMDAGLRRTTVEERPALLTLRSAGSTTPRP